MVRAESVIMAGIGAILGTCLGTVFALVVSRPLAGAGLRVHAADRHADRVFIVSAIAGVVAAIPPARRASNVDVLRAVTTE